MALSMKLHDPAVSPTQYHTGLPTYSSQAMTQFLTIPLRDIEPHNQRVRSMSRTALILELEALILSLVKACYPTITSAR